MSNAQNTSSKAKPNTNTHHTPQPSTPIERAGSDYSDWDGDWILGKNINKYM
jgi:hypothetical protein